MHIFSTLLLSAFTTLLFAQPAFNWAYTYDTSYVCNGVEKKVIDPLGNIYCISNGVGISKRSCILVKIDQFGNEAWHRIDTGMGTICGMYDVILDNNHNVYVCGTLQNLQNDAVGFVAKYSAAGTLLWKRYAIGGTDTCIHAASLIFFNNYIYVTGSTRSPIFGNAVFLQKFDGNGNSIWNIVDNLATLQDDYVNDITNDGKDILVTGFTNYHIVLGAQVFFAKYDTTGGKIYQRVDINGMGREIITDKDRNIYIRLEQAQVDLRKYNSFGYHSWSNTAYPDGLVVTSRYTNMRLDNDENLYLSGAASIGGGIDGQSAFLLTKLRPDGTMAFNYVGQTPGGAGGFDFLTQNDIVVSGNLDSIGGSLINFDSSGTVKWTLRYIDDEPYAGCGAVMTDNGGNIVISGRYDVNPFDTKPAMQVMKYGSTFISEVSQPENNPQFVVFPNPAHGYLNIKLNSPQQAPIQVQLRNTSGQLVLQEHISTPKQHVTLNCTGFSAGMYFLELNLCDTRQVMRIVLE